MVKDSINAIGEWITTRKVDNKLRIRTATGGASDICKKLFIYAWMNAVYDIILYVHMLSLVETPMLMDHKSDNLKG